MSVQSTINRKDYTGDGTTTTFAYDFLIFDQNHLEVFLNGVLQTITTHYTVTGVNNPTGGNVIFTTAPSAGVAITIKRTVPLTQTIDYIAESKFPADTHERGLDLLTMIAQQLKENLDRILSFKVQSLLRNPVMADGVVGKFLRWKTTTEIENVDITALGTVGVPISPVNGGTGRNITPVKGDLLVGQVDSTFGAKAVGADGKVLKALSTQPDGVEWGDVTAIKEAGGAVLNVGAIADNQVVRRSGASLLGTPLAGLPGLRNLKGTYNAAAPDTQIDFTADLVALRNPTTGEVIVRSATATLTNNISLAGPAANGRDQAAAFPTTSPDIHFYYIWNGAALATISSLSPPSTGPTLPTGYTHWAYITTVKGTGTPTILKRGFIRGRSFYYETFQITALNSGAATVDTQIDIPQFVPAIADDYYVWGRVVTASAIISMTPGVEYVNMNNPAFKEGLGIPTFPNVSQRFFYRNDVAGGSTDLFILGYTVPNGA